MSTNKLKTILEMWEEFERETMPKNAPPIQTQEMRRAFYSGFADMLALVIAWGESDLPDEAIAAHFDLMTAELARFGLLLKKGVA